MDRRLGIVLLIVASLLAMPAFCLGGGLDHSCGSEQPSHEHDGCASDPCDLARESRLDDDRTELPSVVVHPTPMPAPAVPATASALRDLRPGPEPPPRTRPLHASDVPLLI